MKSFCSLPILSYSYTSPCVHLSFLVLPSSHLHSCISYLLFFSCQSSSNTPYCMPLNKNPSVKCPHQFVTAVSTNSITFSYNRILITFSANLSFFSQCIFLHYFLNFILIYTCYRHCMFSLSRDCLHISQTPSHTQTIFVSFSSSLLPLGCKYSQISLSTSSSKSDHDSRHQLYFHFWMTATNISFPQSLAPKNSVISSHILQITHINYYFFQFFVNISSLPIQIYYIYIYTYILHPISHPKAPIKPPVTFQSMQHRLQAPACL